ncbi:MAG: hypothetical protein ACRC17_12035 [Culicoidibacterales bacterium]
MFKLTIKTMIKSLAILVGMAVMMSAQASALEGGEKQSFSEPGIYEVQYEVEDSQGNKVIKKRRVVVEESTVAPLQEEQQTDTDRKSNYLIVGGEIVVATTGMVVITYQIFELYRDITVYAWYRRKKRR